MDEKSFAWSAVVWIQDNFKELGLTVFYSLCLMTLFAVINRKVSQRRRDVELARITAEDDSLSLRKLSRFESSIDHLHKFGGSIVVFALIIKTKVYISPSLVKNALVYLTKKNEILRAKISRKKTRIGGKKRIEKEWEEMENPDFAEFHLKLKAMTSDQWQTVFERELTKQFPEGGPLWRFVMLKEQYNPEEGMYSQSFVLSTHYLVCDSCSGFVFFKDFMESISRQLQSMDDSEQITENELRPPLHELMKNQIQISQPAVLYSACKLFIDRMIRRIKPKPLYKNPFTSVYPPRTITDPKALKKTCLIPRSLSKEETKNLLKLCKANQCTVHGAIAAIATISMATILQKGGRGVPLSVTFSFSVDLRKESEPVIGTSELGYYTVDCKITISCECTQIPLSICNPAFWTFAQECDIALRNAIQNGEHLVDLRLMETLHVNITKRLGDLANDANNAGRTRSLFRISNLGKRVAMETSTDCIINGFYFALAEHNIGPVFSNNIVTVNGILYWSFVYFTNVLTEPQALEYVNVVMENFKI